MSHFAQVINGFVQQVIVAEQDFINTLPDKESWVQTSYNTKGNVHYGQDGLPDGGTPLRGNYAGIGFIYDKVNDVFYEPRPENKTGVFNSWTLNETTWSWEPPVPYPTENNPDGTPTCFLWDEPSQTWVRL